MWKMFKLKEMGSTFHHNNNTQMIILHLKLQCFNNFSKMNMFPNTMQIEDNKLQQMEHNGVKVPIIILDEYLESFKIY
jgi:hypothetical protein